MITVSIFVSTLEEYGGTIRSMSGDRQKTAPGGKLHVVLPLSCAHPEPGIL